MKKLFLEIVVILLKIVYMPFKLLPIEDKITFFSRQSNTSTMDITLLSKAIHRELPEIQVRILTREIGKGVGSRFAYCFHMLRQMYHLATSRIVIIDGYCIAVSVLPHKKKTKVIQMWHACCAIKKFGWQTVDKASGSSYTTAAVMNMHANYDYVLAPSKATAQHFRQGFRVSPEKVRYIGMPHFSQLLIDEPAKKEAILKDYPALREKTNVLYIPTFRKGKTVNLRQLAESLDSNEYNLIARLHPLCPVEENISQVIFDSKYTTYDWIKLADYIITDYSSLALEAALLRKKIFFYLYDIEEYMEDPGLNIKITDEAIGKYVFRDAGKLKTLLKEDYELNSLDEFRNKYIEVEAEYSITAFLSLIKELL